MKLKLAIVLAAVVLVIAVLTLLGSLWAAHTVQLLLVCTALLAASLLLVALALMDIRRERRTQERGHAYERYDWSIPELEDEEQQER